MQLNPTGRFTGLAETYARCRPSYPDDAIGFIIALSALGPDSLIIDVGCGTGIASRLFAQRGLKVLGVEPNDDMRGKAEEARQNDLAQGNEQTAHLLTYTQGTAEATNLQGASADLVISAQAFHWFDPQKSLAEFHRILKIKGWVALMWNERDESDEFTNKYGDIFRTARETAGVEGPRQKAGNALLENGLFENRQRDIFTSSQIMDEEGVVGRAFSASYAPKENPEKEQFEKSLRALFNQYALAPEPGAAPVVTMHYATSVYTGQRLDEE
jgi:ubiquinone/menaquinone biosynthesis C-methylase UbiE